MSNVPQISGQQQIKALAKMGFGAVRQKGSHIRLYRDYQGQKQIVTIPNYKTMRKGTLLNGILKTINLSIGDLI